jgi:cell division protein FtsB
MNKLLSSPLVIFLLVLILIGIIAVVGKESYRKYQIDKEVGGIKKEIESLKEKNQALSNLLDYFNSEESLEKEARLKLNLLKEGEKLVIITPNKKTDSENQFSEDIEEKQPSNFEKWLKYLFKD